MSQNGQTHFKNFEANARFGLRSQAWGENFRTAATYVV